MTGPNPDAELDEALGVTQLPPAAVTDDHCRAAMAALWPSLGHTDPDDLNVASQRQLARAAQAVADAEQRAVARYIAERDAAGVQLDGRLLAAREDYAELTRAAEYHLDRCEAARADQTATGLPFAVGEARRRFTR